MSFPIHTLSSSDDSDNGECDLASRLQKKMDAPNKMMRIESNESEYYRNVDVSSNIMDFSPTQINQNDHFTYENRKEDISPCPYASDDSLPAIESENVFSDGFDNRGGKGKVMDDIVLSSPPKIISDKQKLKVAKEAEKLERKIAREAKKAEKERLKEEKENEKMAKKSVKPGECIKFVVVCLDQQIIVSVPGSGIISRLVEMGVEYRVIEQRIPLLVTFLRKDPLTGEETKEDDALIIYSDSDFIPLVQKQIHPDVEHYAVLLPLGDQCNQWKSTLNTNQLTIVVCGLESFHKDQDKLKQRHYKSQLLPNETKKGRGRKKTQVDENDDFINISRIDVETALVTAQLRVGVNHRMCLEPASVAHYVAMVTKAIAERPFKQSLQSTAFSWHAESSCANTVKIDKNGTGLLRLWHAQLRQLTNVGLETAQAIAGAYGSPSLLVKAYQGLSTKEASLLLSEIPIRRGQGVLANSRKLGPELSKKIYLLFMSTNPERNLDDKELEVN